MRKNYESIKDMKAIKGMEEAIKAKNKMYYFNEANYYSGYENSKMIINIKESQYAKKNTGDFDHDKTLTILTWKDVNYTIETLPEFIESIGTNVVLTLTTTGNRVSMCSNILTQTIFETRDWGNHIVDASYTYNYEGIKAKEESEDAADNDIDNVDKDADTCMVSKREIKERRTTDLLLKVSFADEMNNLLSNLGVIRDYENVEIPQEYLSSNMSRREIHRLNREYKKSNTAKYRKAWEDIAIAMMNVGYKNGVMCNGAKYYHYCTSPSDYKTGEALFVHEDLFKLVKPQLDRIKELGFKSKFNLIKHNQYGSLEISSAIEMNVSKEAMRHIYVIDIESNEYEGIIDGEVRKLFHSRPTYKYALKAFEKGSPYSFKFVKDYISSIDDEICSSDGFSSMNSIYLDGGDIWNNSLIQGRAIGVKTMCQIFNYERIEDYFKAQGYADDDFILTDVKGTKFRFKDAFMILDKNSCKYYEQYKASEFTSYYDFMVYVQGNDNVDFYINHFFIPEKPNKKEVIKYGKQPMQWMDFTTDKGKAAITELLKLDYDELERKYSADELAKTVAAGLKSQAVFSALAELDENDNIVITNGNIMSHPYFMAQAQKMYNADVRDMLQAAHIYGHQLIVLPDILEYFEILFHHGTEAHGMCGKYKNLLVTPAYETGEKVLSIRYPVLGFDMDLSTNAYNEYDEFEKEFLSPAAVYIGSKAESWKRLQADCDGDKVMITNNKTIIESVMETREKYKYPVVLFNDLDSSYAESIYFKDFKECFKDDPTGAKAEATIAVINFRNNLVGTYTAILSNIANEITSHYGNEFDVELVMSMIARDMAVMQQATQFYVDAQKKGGVILPDTGISAIEELTFDRWDEEDEAAESERESQEYFDRISEEFDDEM